MNDHIIVHQGSDYIPEFMDEPLAILGFLAAETQHVTLGTRYVAHSPQWLSDITW